MAQQIKIKDIAERAGVSAGTVDRIIHGRGNVSQKNRAAVEAVLKEVGYRPNVHTSAVALKKTYRFSVCIPLPDDGEYWGSVKKGIESALDEYSDVSIVSRYFCYDQTDPASCRECYDAVAEEPSDIVILGPTFEELTVDLCARLDSKGIPYIFVDCTIPNTRPVAAFCADQPSCGRLLGSIIRMISPQDKEVIIAGRHRVGPATANNTREIREGLFRYMEEFSDCRPIFPTAIIGTAKSDCRNELELLLKDHPDTGLVAVINSRGHLVADALRDLGRKDIRVISFDLTRQNERCLREGSIDLIILQHPEMQSFLAVKAAIEYLIYHKRDDDPMRPMPIDIITRENIPGPSSYFNTKSQ